MRARSTLLVSAFAAALAIAATTRAHAQSDGEGSGGGGGGGSGPSTRPGEDVDVQRAAAEYEAGRRAYQEKRYSDAGFHFESAFLAAPRAEALRNAIRTRNMARETERAATLAAVAEKRYPTDAPTMVLVREILSEASTKLGRVEVSCTPACTLRVDGSPPALGELAAEQHRVYVKPGTRSFEARFAGRGAQITSIDVPVGGREEWKIEPIPDPNAKVDKGGPEGTKTKELPGPAADSDKPLPKGVFYVGAGLTAIGLATTIAFYIDQKRVEKEELSAYNACDPDVPGDCPDGSVSKGARRKTLIVGLATGAVGIGTAVVGLFFTRWTSKDPAPSVSSNTRVQPLVVPLRDGAAFGLTGRF
ncbi:MAG: hypothetical protein U0235_32170 [Polyangiaceae bacterium]